MRTHLEFRSQIALFKILLLLNKTVLAQMFLIDETKLVATI